MAERLLIIAQPQDWAIDLPGATVIAPRDYLSGASLPAGRHTRVLNLCRSYRYLSEGYYCSLLAEARGHRVIPSVRTTQDLSRKSIYLLGLEGIDLGRALAGVKGDEYSLDIAFGHCAVQGFHEIARQVFTALPAPLLRVSFRRQGHWRIEGVSALGIQTLDGTAATFSTRGSPVTSPGHPGRPAPAPPATTWPSSTTPTSPCPPPTAGPCAPSSVQGGPPG